MKTKYNGIVKLSDEKFTILSTTGQLQLNDGSILTYDPTSTLYITPKSYNQFTDADKQKVDVIKLDGDGEKYLADDGQYKELNSVQVANENDAILYKHNISLDGTNSTGYQINARVIAFSRNNTSISTYNQLMSITSEAVDYPINGYVYSSDNTLLGTLIYYNHIGNDSLEFTTASANSIEVIELEAAQCTISDTVALVE